MKVEADFGDQPERDKFWNACRVHHCLHDGCFMVIPCDGAFGNLYATHF